MFLRKETAKANLVITNVMTVAGQKNHYNVKLLKGNGISTSFTKPRNEFGIKSSQAFCIKWLLNGFEHVQHLSDVFLL
jgi:hypothetical protein